MKRLRTALLLVCILTALCSGACKWETNKNNVATYPTESDELTQTDETVRDETVRHVMHEWGE